MNAVGIDVSKGKSMVALLRSLGVTVVNLIQMIFVSVFLSLLHLHIAFISLNIWRFIPFALHVLLSFRVNIWITSTQQKKETRGMAVNRYSVVLLVTRLV